ncbi:MAG: adenylate/guanylate cyclase domain-containing protein [Chrysiogenetes bacterium]|nr:adenylate/guanylate cyclase domain-containing protein [Chrysiogenetes bacterium]
MSESPASRENPLSRFFEWVGNPLERSQADRCLFLTLLLWPLLSVGHYVWYQEIMSRPHEATAVWDFTLLVAECLTWIIRGWVVLTLLALALRKVWPDSDFFPFAACTLYALTTSMLCYGWGPTTTYFLGFATIGGLIGGVLIFGWTPTLVSSVLCFGSLIGADVAAYHGVIPYAPVYRTLVAGGAGMVQPDAAWLVRTWIGAIGGCVVSASAFGYIFHRWHRREDDLARAQQQLSHAMDMIRRYVPAQLADQILDGRYSEKERYVRRTLTLFFSDIRGFTETADQLESEKLSELLNEYLTEMSDIAESFGGTIDKFVGDAVVIFFGAPEPMEEKEQALRAVRMALAMQARMGELSKKWYESGIQTPFEIRVGINTGAATVGDFGSEGRMDYTAIGTQVNLAARLESQCTPGKVLISHATWGLVHDEIACTPRGEIQVKGIHYPVKVYEIEADATAPSEDTR